MDEIVSSIYTLEKKSIIFGCWQLLHQIISVTSVVSNLEKVSIINISVSITIAYFSITNLLPFLLVWLSFIIVFVMLISFQSSFENLYILKQFCILSTYQLFLLYQALLKKCHLQVAFGGTLYFIICCNKSGDIYRVSEMSRFIYFDIVQFG